MPQGSVGDVRGFYLAYQGQHCHFPNWTVGASGPGGQLAGSPEARGRHAHTFWRSQFVWAGSVPLKQSFGHCSSRVLLLSCSLQELEADAHIKEEHNGAGQGCWCKASGLACCHCHRRCSPCC